MKFTASHIVALLAVAIVSVVAATTVLIALGKLSLVALGAALGTIGGYVVGLIQRPPEWARQALGLPPVPPDREVTLPDWSSRK